jgi:hypothetical protein
MILQDLTLGEQVYLDREMYPGLVDDMIERYGEGPFNVVGLRQYPKGARDHVLATYAVTIELADGERKEMAGEWFRRESDDGRKLSREWMQGGALYEDEGSPF